MLERLKHWRDGKWDVKRDVFGVGNVWGSRIWMMVGKFRIDGSCVDTGNDSSRKKFLTFDSR